MFIRAAQPSAIDGKLILVVDESVQAEALNEMIEYIKNSGMKRAFYFTWQTNAYGIIKSDGTYRQLWDKAF